MTAAGKTSRARKRLEQLQVVALFVAAILATALIEGLL